MTSTKVYSVFPACGKTYCYENQEDYGLKILDSDSSEFSWIRTNGAKERNPDLSNNYIKHITKCDDTQAERTAWHNLKDWIAAQVALVETEQATMDELFFPKLVDRSERTPYEVFQTGQLMLGDGGTYGE